MEIDQLYNGSVELLKKLIKTPSLSTQEHDAADIIRKHLDELGDRKSVV